MSTTPPTRMDRTAGYTLMEVLVMLAVTALLTATVLETVRASASNGVRIERAARLATQDYLTIASLRHAVSGSRTDYADSPSKFTGSPERFTALTSNPIAAETTRPTTYSVSLVREQDEVSLVYTDDVSQFTVAQWPNARARFSYYGEEAVSGFEIGTRAGESLERQWFPTWPPEGTSGAIRDYTFYTPMPLAVRAEIFPETGETLEIVFYLPANAPPPLRTRDLLGGGPG